MKRKAAERGISLYKTVKGEKEYRKLQDAGKEARPTHNEED